MQLDHKLLDIFKRCQNTLTKTKSVIVYNNYALLGF